MKMTEDHGRKQQKWKLFVWNHLQRKGTFEFSATSHATCHMISGALSHWPPAIKSIFPTKGKLQSENGIPVMVFAFHSCLYSFSLDRCYYPWGSNMSQYDFFIWTNLCTISIAARTSCLIVTPWKGQLLSRKNGGKNWPTPPSNGQWHQQSIRSVTSLHLVCHFCRTQVRS